MNVLNVVHAQVAANLAAHTDDAALVGALATECPAEEVIAAIDALRSLGILDARRPRWKNGAVARVAPALLGLLASRCQVLELPADGGPCHLFVALDANTGTPAGGVACGFTPAEGLLACLGEAAESASTAGHAADRLLYLPWHEARATAVHPHELLHLSEAQRTAREAPAPFDETANVHWVEAHDPTRDTGRLLPAAWVFSDHLTRYPREDFAKSDSNGCAVGATLDEATLGALCELIERDATAIWWYGRHRRPAAFVRTTLFASVEDWNRRRERTLRLIDLRTDIDLPVTAAVSADENGGRVLLGFGAHPDAEHAERKALRELVQLEHGAMLTGWEADGPLGSWATSVDLATQPQLNPDEGARPATTASIDPPHGTTALDRALAAIEGAGLSALRVDLTRVEVGLACVRMVVPELRHYHPRFAPGRLYQVPERLGWCPAGRTERDLNPVALTI